MRATVPARDRHEDVVSRLQQLQQPLPGARLTAVVEARHLADAPRSYVRVCRLADPPVAGNLGQGLPNVPLGVKVEDSSLREIGTS